MGFNRWSIVIKRLAACFAGYGILFLWGNVTAADQKSRPIFNRLGEIVRTGMIWDSQVVSELLEIKLEHSVSSTNPKLSIFALKDISPASSMTAQPFNYTVLGPQSAQYEVVHLQFSLDPKKICISRSEVEKSFGVGERLMPPLHSTRPEGSGTDDYGIYYRNMSFGHRTVSMAFTFSWRPCLERVFISDTSAKGR